MVKCVENKVLTSVFVDRKLRDYMQEKARIHGPFVYEYQSTKNGPRTKVCVREWEINYQLHMFKITSQCSQLLHDIRPRSALQHNDPTGNIEGYQYGLVEEY